MKFKIKDVNIYKYIEGDIKGPVKVEVKKGEEDQLVINYDGLEKKINNLGDQGLLKDNLWDLIRNLNAQMDGLMDTGFRDGGDVGINEEDGEDTEYLKQLAGEINKIFNNTLTNSNRNFSNPFETFENEFNKEKVKDLEDFLEELRKKGKGKNQSLAEKGWRSSVSGKVDCGDGTTDESYAKVVTRLSGLTNS